MKILLLLGFTLFAGISYSQNLRTGAAYHTGNLALYNMRENAKANFAEYLQNKGSLGIEIIAPEGYEVKFTNNTHEVTLIGGCEHFDRLKFSSENVEEDRLSLTLLKNNSEVGSTTVSLVDVFENQEGTFFSYDGHKSIVEDVENGEDVKVIFFFTNEQ